ncbi:glutathione S-transferase C-terminal domain-containing protein [Actinoplanes sp. GCM10030250]|uniref:glutathione S-transferase C-terminal domain-containing protein n=1 Tax=Actinoplanes sp. GCM10030250 TaxID=3273376 RepID=UPI00360C2171
MPDLRLITFPPSLDSEFSRFLLTHYGVAHEERRHTLGYSSLVTLRHGHTVRFPLVYGATLRLNTVEKIVEHFDARCAPERRLLDGAGFGADWKLFHGTLGGATTVFAYYHLLPERSVMVGPLSAGTPAREAAAVRRAYPAFATALRLLLRLTDARERAARLTIRSVLDDLDRRLADGRPYLTGDRFTLADMAFAVAAAPVVWPGEYGGAVPDLADTPPPLRALIDESRQRPSGRHALSVFRTRRVAQPASRT